MEQKYGKSLHMLKLWCQLLLISVAPNLSASGTGFVEDNFSTDQGGGGGWGAGWFGDDSSALHLLCTFCYYYVVIYDEIIIQLTIMQNQWEP